MAKTESIICQSFSGPTQSRSVTRSFTWYDRETDELIGEIDLSDLDETAINTVFNESDKPLLTDCYPLPIHKADAMQQLVGKQILIQPTNYDYFLEITAAN